MGRVHLNLVCSLALISITAVPLPASAAVERCNGKAVTDKVSNSNRFAGTAKAEVILGTGKDDEIDGGGGADHICAGGGADVIDGGPGPDHLFGDATVTG